MPARSTQLGWVLLPLRAFLAFVYLYAGISKIADSRFLSASSPTGIRATLIAVRPASPIGSLLGPVQDHTFAFGLLIAIGEIAVGVGLALGLFTRVAAAGGMLLSLSLFLTVSWGATPWYTGADIGYFFALSPLLIGGAGGLWSVDSWLDSVTARHSGGAEDRTRRGFVAGGAFVVVLVLAGAAALFRRAKPAPKPAVTGASADLVAAVAVPVGGAKQVTDPSSGDQAWVLQLTAGSFTAFDATCPHQGCAVSFVSPADGFACPCHGSLFTAQGKRISGPAPRGLTAIPVTVVQGSVRRS